MIEKNAVDNVQQNKTNSCSHTLNFRHVCVHATQYTIPCTAGLELPAIRQRAKADSRAHVTENVWSGIIPAIYIYEVASRETNMAMRVVGTCPTLCVLVSLLCSNDLNVVALTTTDIIFPYRMRPVNGHADHYTVKVVKLCI